jgi:hypothetical protein
MEEDFHQGFACTMDIPKTPELFNQSGDGVAGTTPWEGEGKFQLKQDFAGLILKIENPHNVILVIDVKAGAGVVLREHTL